ncbi:MAG: class I SAM-dependent methyltransferase [Myxococcales bacterium]|nr:class I SAM-dependent methyltransferase [Myxococcales bacterium]
MSVDETSLREGTHAHYRDAAYYDQAYRRRREDVRFYADLADSAGGSVLELGVGTGRVALELARRGVPIVGVDLMEEMLARLRERLRKEPRRVRAVVELHRGDLREIRLGRRFPLVISPFNVFMHLYERGDLERALETVREHLAPGGLFVFDVLVPCASALALDPDRVYRLGTIRRGGRSYHYRERFDYNPITQIQHVEMIFIAEDAPGKPEIMPLTHRHFFPAELEALLHYNGFEVLRREGDFEGGPLVRESESQVLTCRLRDGSPPAAP